jgi:hypothetical protein
VSRIWVAALALALTALGFGLGYQTGLSREQPRRAPIPPPRAVAPPAPSALSAAVHEALANPDRLERMLEIGRLLQPLGSESIGEVTAAYDAAFVEVGDVAIVLLADWWARLDPAGAFAWAQRERMANSPMVIKAVVRAWAEREPEEAARAIEGVGTRGGSPDSVDALVRGWNDSGKPGLLDYLSGLPSGVARQRAISVVTRRRVYQYGVEETFRWAEAIPDDAGRFKLNVFRRVATWATEVDPQRAAAWAERHGQEEYGKGLFRRVGNRWARQDGAAAMQWLATLPAGAERDAGVQETYRAWLGHEEEAAKAWMRAAELEPWLEPALALYVRDMARESPEQALEWTALILDAERRREATIKIGRYWHHVDPDAARAWLDRSGLPEEDRKWVLSPLPGSGGRRAAPQQGDFPLREGVFLEEEG